MITRLEITCGGPHPDGYRVMTFYRSKPEGSPWLVGDEYLVGGGSIDAPTGLREYYDRPDWSDRYLDARGNIQVQCRKCRRSDVRIRPTKLDESLLKVATVLDALKLGDDTDGALLDVGHFARIVSSS